MTAVDKSSRILSSAKGKYAIVHMSREETKNYPLIRQWLDILLTKVSNVTVSVCNITHLPRPPGRELNQERMRDLHHLASC